MVDMLGKFRSDHGNFAIANTTQSRPLLRLARAQDDLFLHATELRLQAIERKAKENLGHPTPDPAASKD